MAVEPVFTVPDEIDFRGAIAVTQSLLDAIEQDQVTAATIDTTIRALVCHVDGARGFFVTYLSDDRPLAEPLMPTIIAALQSAPMVVSPLLVKNLAMSTAMAITHRRNQDAVMATGSERVRARTAQLIQALQLPEVDVEAQDLMRAIETQQGDYEHFLNRWSYDTEQRQAIWQTLNAIGTESRQ